MEEQQSQTRQRCGASHARFCFHNGRTGAVLGLWIAVGQELKQADQTKRQVVREKNRNQKSWNFTVLCLIWSAIPRHHYSAAPLSPSIQLLLLLMLSVKPTMKLWLGDKAFGTKMFFKNKQQGNWIICKNTTTTLSPSQNDLCPFCYNNTNRVLVIRKHTPSFCSEITNSMVKYGF